MEVTVNEFPFVAELPKRDAKKVKTLWEEFKDLSAIARERGAFVPTGVAAALLGVSKQRVSELIKLGRFEVVSIHGRNFVMEDSIVAFAESERAAGRPWPGPKSVKEAADIALKVGMDHYRSCKKSSK